MAGRADDDAAVRSPFRPAMLRVVGIAVAFLVVTAGLFAGVGAWRGDDAATAEPAPVEEPSDDGDVAPAPAPEPAADEAPEPEPVPEPEPEPEPEPVGPDPADVTVQLLDAELDDGGAALGRAADALDAFDVVARNRVAESRADAYAATTVLYTPGFEAEGRLVAATLGATEVRAVTPENRLSDAVMVHVVVKG